MTTPAIWAKDLAKEFNGKTVVNDLDLDIPEGTIYGFIGPSGSGKTTSLRMLTGVTERTRGEVKLLGRAPEHLRRKDREAIGYTPQLGVLYPHLTIMDNLRFMANLYGMAFPNRRIKEVLAQLDLSDAANRQLKEASGGMQRRVALAGAILHNPRLLFLDEPSAGLDPVLRREVWKQFHGLRAEGRTLFVTTQIVSEAARCDQVGLLVDGQIVAEDTPDGLRIQAFGGHVIDLYLTQPASPDLLTALHAHPLVNTLAQLPTHAKAVRVTVDKVETDIPILRAVIADYGNELILSERYLAPFDDVFVALLEAHRASQAPKELEATASDDAPLLTPTKTPIPVPSPPDMDLGTTIDSLDPAGPYGKH
ncbi:ABC transporter ATP-binding protein [Stomatohabitans albus]|uniref:ABC transporter ATP-binding protein n=1 Tax=Stomatohabitans albus TaxID=3110766 RepID=UPI00300D9E14